MSERGIAKYGISFLVVKFNPGAMWLIVKKENKGAQDVSQFCYLVVQGI